MGTNKLLKIKGPRGTATQIQTKNGSIKVRLDWDPNYAPKMQNALQKVQADLDQEVLRLVSPYIPFQTGLLEKSGPISTDIGSGEVIHATPYAGVQFYDTADSRSYDPLRGGHWGPRMKADKLPQIENFVRKRVKAHVGDL